MKPKHWTDSPWFSVPFVFLGLLLWIWATCAVPN